MVFLPTSSTESATGTTEGPEGINGLRTGEPGRSNCSSGAVNIRRTGFGFGFRTGRFVTIVIPLRPDEDLGGVFVSDFDSGLGVGLGAGALLTDFAGEPEVFAEADRVAPDFVPDFAAGFPVAGFGFFEVFAVLLAVRFAVFFAAFFAVVFFTAFFADFRVGFFAVVLAFFFAAFVTGFFEAAFLRTFFLVVFFFEPVFLVAAFETDFFAAFTER